MPALLDPFSLDSTYTIFDRHLTIRETEPELTAPGSQKAMLYFNYTYRSQVPPEQQLAGGPDAAAHGQGARPADLVS